ncbi:hypothetical protein L6R53_31470 [Myxococcota bacterium]|nr:hypothetical protein [Myxococcota bacterium]
MGLLLVVIIQAAGAQDRDGGDEVVAAGLAKVPSIETIFADEGCAAACKRRLDANNPGLRVEVMRHPANRSVATRVQAQEAVVD